ncbi:hypothetical protein PQR71_07780 [Paraburkholderia fungorum]|uniref:hypothetical protein n=1 Tax=Paraburkholderia fungorum TaxID=134537 RepID=UPI0038B8D53C
MNILNDVTIPRDFLADSYDNLDGVRKLLHEAAVKGRRCSFGYFEELAQGFPVLRDAHIGYLEISGEDVANSDLSDWDKRALTLALLTNPCGIISVAVPILIVAESFEGLDPDRKRIAATHELVHLEQVIRGDFLYIEGGGYTWRGLVCDDIGELNVGLIRGDARSLVAYLALPWEREAIERSEGVDAYQRRFQDASIIAVVADATVDGAAGDRDARERDLASTVAALIDHALQNQATDTNVTSDAIGQSVSDAIFALGFDLHQGGGKKLWALVCHFVSEPERYPIDTAEGVYKNLIAVAERVRSGAAQ